MNPAAFPLSTPPAVTLPPGEDELPYDDGEPMESDKHRQQMELCIETLQLALLDHDDVYVGGNLGLYFSETQVKKNDFRAPDVMVVLNTVRRPRKSWVVWGEEGRTPDVIIELLSESTEAQDRGAKMRVYAGLRVPEYYLFDPWDGRLEGYALDPKTNRYVAMTPLPGGDVPCHQLGLRLGVRSGRFRGEEWNWLRWLDAEGDVLPTAEEQAHAAEAKANVAEAKASAAEAKANEAEQEIARLREQVAAYERGRTTK